MDRIENGASNNSFIVARIRYCGNVFTEQLPSNIHIQTHRLMGRIEEVRRWDGLSCHDTHTKYHKDWLGIQKLIGGYAESIVIA
jgi:DNA-binding GntR family transcriptional regulator